MKHIFSVTALAGIAGAALLISLMSGCGPAQKPFTDQWPQYRGPAGDGVSLSKAAVVPWTEDKEPTLVWKVPAGDGFSGISLAGEQLFVAFGGDSSEYLAAFDRRSGSENWRLNIGRLFVEEFGDGPRATPAVLDGRVFIYNSRGHLWCADAATGELLWDVPLAETYSIPMIKPERGFTNSPMIMDGKVIMYTGGLDSTAFMALDPVSGELLWKTGSSTVSYSSPTPATIHGVPQLLFTAVRVVEENGRKKGVNEVVSVSPGGEILWRGPSVRGIIAMPVFVAPDMVFVSSQLEVGSKMIRVDHSDAGWSAEEVWSSENMRNHFNSTVYRNGYLYGFSNATLECLDAATGERRWRKRGLGKGSLVAADGKLIILSDKGKLAIAEATPEKYTELASAKVMDGKSWTCPTWADGFLYLRNRKEMACYDLTE